MARPVFLITGAAGGIGSATARRAVAAGYRVVLAGRDEARLNVLAEELGGPDVALGVRCDVQDWAAQLALVERTLETWGRLDVAFANAGVAAGAGFVRGEATPEQWRTTVLTNIFGVAATARLSVQALIESRGHLLGSVVGRVPIPGSLYSATKWAVTGMSESIRAEQIGTAVRVTVVRPHDRASWLRRHDDSSSPPFGGAAGPRSRYAAARRRSSRGLPPPRLPPDACAGLRKAAR